MYPEKLPVSDSSSSSSDSDSSISSDSDDGVCDVATNKIKTELSTINIDEMKDKYIKQYKSIQDEFGPRKKPRIV